MAMADEKGPHDEVVEQDGAVLLIEPSAIMYLLGTEMDYKTDKLASQFVFNNPNQRARAAAARASTWCPPRTRSVLPTTNDPLMTAPAPEPAWVGDVLAFWFTELDRKAWFVRDAAVDEKIRARFGPLIGELASRPVEEALASPERALATVIALDQFPRNVFRGTARAFATDALALAVAKAAIDRGLDSQVPAERRVFLYLPFEHSEALADQDRSVELTAALGDEEYARYAVLHRDVIKRFGRFPHRNVMLGRTPTLEELTFLKEPGSSF